MLRFRLYLFLPLLHECVSLRAAPGWIQIVSITWLASEEKRKETAAMIAAQTSDLVYHFDLNCDNFPARAFEVKTNRQEAARKQQEADNASGRAPANPKKFAAPAKHQAGQVQPAPPPGNSGKHGGA